MSYLIVPFEGTGTREDPRRPKYLRTYTDDWGAVDHGDSAVAWANLTPAQEADIVLNADVRLIPPLDNTVAVNATRQALEDLNVPGHWVSAGMTYRTVLRVVVGMAQLISTLEELGVRVTLAGNLERTLGSLAASTRTAIAVACDARGIDRSSIVGGTTLREALRIFGQQFAQGRAVGLRGL